MAGTVKRRFGVQVVGHSSETFLSDSAECRRLRLMLEALTEREDMTAGVIDVQWLPTGLAIAVCAPRASDEPKLSQVMADAGFTINALLEVKLQTLCAALVEEVGASIIDRINEVWQHKLRDALAAADDTGKQPEVE